MENAVKAILAKGYRTPDIFTQGCKLIGTEEAGRLILEEI
jgi:3-isopropylmalate dehydrogenase